MYTNDDDDGIDDDDVNDVVDDGDDHDDDSSSGASSDGDDGVSGNGRPAQWLCQPQWRRTESCGETYRATQGSTAKKSDQQNKGTWPVA